MTVHAEQDIRDEVIHRLDLKFPDLSERDIAQAVEHAYRPLQDSPIREYVPVLVERAAGDELRHRPV